MTTETTVNTVAQAVTQAVPHDALLLAAQFEDSVLFRHIPANKEAARMLRELYAENVKLNKLVDRTMSPYMRNLLSGTV